MLVPVQPWARMADLVGAAVDPGCSCRTVEQLAVAEVLTGVGIEHSIGKVGGKEHLIGHVPRWGSRGAGAMMVMNGRRWWG